MSTDSDYARRSVAIQRIANEIPSARNLLHHARLNSTEQTARLAVFGEACGDLAHSIGHGHRSQGNEWALIGALAMVALEDEMALEARCVCPLQVGVPSEDRFVHPDCPAHGENA